MLAVTININRLRSHSAPCRRVGTVVPGVMTAASVMRPIRLPSSSANHMLPSGPAVMPSGNAPAVIPALNSVTTPSGVIRPIRLAPGSVNHRLPSGPAAMPTGAAQHAHGWWSQADGAAVALIQARRDDPKTLTESRRTCVLEVQACGSRLAGSLGCSDETRPSELD